MSSSGSSSASPVSPTKRPLSPELSSPDDSSDDDSSCSSSSSPAPKQLKRDDTTTTEDTPKKKFFRVIATRISCMKMLLWAFRVKHEGIVAHFMDEWNIAFEVKAGKKGAVSKFLIPWKKFLTPPELIGASKTPPSIYMDFPKETDEAAVNLYNCTTLPFYGGQFDREESAAALSPWMFVDYFGTGNVEKNERCPESCHWEQHKGTCNEFDSLEPEGVLHYLRCHAWEAKCGGVGEFTDYFFLRIWSRFKVNAKLKLFFLPYSQFKDVGLNMESDGNEFDDAILIGSEGEKENNMDVEKVKGELRKLGMPDFGVKEMLLEDLDLPTYASYSSGE